jgi:flagellin
MKTLAVQSANGIYSNETDRVAIELEYEQLTKELNDISATDFNGVAILSKSHLTDTSEVRGDAGRVGTTGLNLVTSVSFQVGARTKDLKNYDFKYDSVYKTLASATGNSTASPYGAGAYFTAGTDAQSKGIGILSADMDVSASGLGLWASASVNLSTQYDANVTIDKIDNAINKTSLVRAQLGAMDNRLNHKINNLNVTNENIMGAESRIRDTNVADQILELSKAQILTQASQSMLAQANQIPQGVLQLLQ